MINDNRRTILLVEDEAIISFTEEETLRSFGYEVITASSGEEAVEIAANNEMIDLVLMDIDLGEGMDGTSAAKEILGIRTIPIVFLTSHSEFSMVEKVRGITRYGYVIKNSGDFVLQSSIEMAFELFNAHSIATMRNRELAVLNEELNSVIDEQNATNEKLIENQHELELSEALFHGLFDNMTSGSAIYTVLHDGSKGSHYIVRVFNKASLRIEGKTLAEVKGKSLFDLRPAIDEYGLIEVMQEVWKTGNPAVFPVKIYQDELFSNYYENYIFKIPTGEIVTIYNDVTEQKMAEQALTDSEEKYRLIVNNISHCVTILDLQFNFLYVSPAITRIRGYTVDEVLTQTIDQILTPESLNIAIKAFEEEMALELDPSSDPLRTRMLELEEYHRDGSIVLLENSMTFIRDDQEKPARILVITSDITQRKRTENELHRKNEIDESLLKTTRTILEVEDFHQTARHIFDACSSLTGAAAGYVALLDDDGTGNEVMFLEAGGHNFTVGPDLSMPIRGLREVVYATGRPAYDNNYQGSEWAQYMPEDHVQLANLLLAPLNIGGKTVGILGIANKPSPFTDEDSRIAETFGDLAALSLRNSRKIDSLLAAQESIQLLLQEKELLLKEVHHRIKNNMSTIAALLGLQSDTIRDVEAAEALNDAKGRVLSMMGLYEILYKSNDLRSVPVNEYIANLIHEISLSYPLTNRIAINHHIEQFSLDSKIIFPIGIIVNELLANALKNAFPGDREGTVTVSISKNIARISITVKDNGIGIPEGFTISSSTGFGLKLINALVRQYNGTIDVIREHGTEFAITIPAGE
ncbi:MAG TPA: PAS domain S-box protein [Spirochaetota bacterium]|nr:PAS domain S-box protein [Spirochaetota bacterium]HQP49004.1 PAS domain S-box protein [Spirochaetota bacterium]